MELISVSQQNKKRDFTSFQTIGNEYYARKRAISIASNYFSKIEAETDAPPLRHAQIIVKKKRETFEQRFLEKKPAVLSNLEGVKKQEVFIEGVEKESYELVEPPLLTTVSSQNFPTMITPAAQETFFDLSNLVEAGGEVASVETLEEQSFDVMIDPLEERFQELHNHVNHLSFSRRYEQASLRFPTHAEFAPFIREIIELDKIFRRIKKKSSHEDSGKLNAWYQEKISSFITALATKIRSEALVSRNLQRAAILGGTLPVPDGYDNPEEYNWVIDAHVDAYDQSKPKRWIERALLEFRELLNVPLKPELRKANRDEIKAFRLLWDFQKRLM